jgi:hypothetical protein
MEKRPTNIANRIMPVAATMVGVCMTVISVIQIIPPLSKSWVDEILAVNSFVFLTSTVMSYWAIRHETGLLRIERYADILFLIGMVIMAIVSFMMAFELFVS